MPQLTPCKACHKEVAKTAKICPACGVKNPGMKAKDWLISLALFSLLVLAVGYWMA